MKAVLVDVALFVDVIVFETVEVPVATAVSIILVVVERLTILVDTLLTK